MSCAGAGSHHGCRFDFNGQIAPTDIRVQIDRACGRAESRAELRLYYRQILRVPHVDFARQCLEREFFAARHPVRLPEKRLDVGNRFAGLRGWIAGVNGSVSDDTRGSGDEKGHATWLVQHRGAGEYRTASAVLWRIV